MGPAVADRVCAGVPEVDGLGELDAYAVAYLSGLLEGTVGDWIVADQDTRIDGCAPGDGEHSRPRPSILGLVAFRADRRGAG